MSLGTINDSSEYLKSLIDTGADAMNNLYYIEFLVPESYGLEDPEKSVVNSLVIRNKNFKMPVFAQETHTVDYLTTSVDLPKPSYSGEKELDFNFRLDGNYGVYKLLKKIQSKTSMPTLSVAMNRVPGQATTAGGSSTEENCFKICVYKLSDKYLSDLSQFETDTNGNIKNKDLLYTFKYCWVKSVTGLSYSYDSSEPLAVNAKVAFLDVQIADEK